MFFRTAIDCSAIAACEGLLAIMFKTLSENAGASQPAQVSREALKEDRRSLFDRDSTVRVTSW